MYCGGVFTLMLSVAFRRKVIHFPSIFLDDNNGNKGIMKAAGINHLPRAMKGEKMRELH